MSDERGHHHHRSIHGVRASDDFRLLPPRPEGQMEREEKTCDDEGPYSADGPAAAALHFFFEEPQCLSPQAQARHSSRLQAPQKISSRRRNA